MGEYQDKREGNLEHLGRPADPDTRSENCLMTLADHRSLVLSNGLREYAGRSVPRGDVRRDIAHAWAGHIDMEVRDEHRRLVRFYPHTPLAVRTLVEAAYRNTDQVDIQEECLEMAHRYAVRERQA